MAQIAKKVLRHFASLIKPKQTKLFYPAALYIFRSDAARRKAPSRRDTMLFYDLVLRVYLHDFWFEISRFFGAKKCVGHNDDDVADADFARGRAV